jgi:hypothetical protein
MIGYTTNASGAFYRRFNSLIAYGLISRHGKFTVSALGKRLAYPESEMDGKMALKEAVLNVPLWAELFKRFGKSPPSENLWVQIKNSTGVEPKLAQSRESQIRKWYLEDISQISGDVISVDSQKSFMPPHANSKIMERSATTGTRLLEPTIEIPFGMKYSVRIPEKMNPKQAFEQIKKYMELFIQEYKEDEKTI